MWIPLTCVKFHVIYTSDFSHVFKVQERKATGFWNVTQGKGLTVVHTQPSIWLQGCTGVSPLNAWMDV